MYRRSGDAAGLKIQAQTDAAYGFTWKSTLNDKTELSTLGLYYENS
jgi:hypothetical protein